MMIARKAAAALCALSLPLASWAGLPLYGEVAAKVAPDGGCVVSGGNTRAIPQAHYMLISLAAGDRDRFDKAASCMRERLQGGQDATPPSSLWGPDPGDGGKDKVLDDSKATEVAVLEAWCLIEAGRIFGGDYDKRGRALLSSIRSGAGEDRVLGTVLGPTLPWQDGDESAIAPAALLPFALARFCAIDGDFCTIRSDSLRAVVRGAGQGYVPDRITFNKDGILTIHPTTTGSDEAARFWHYVALTSPGDPDRALLETVLSRLGARLDLMLRPPKREFMHPRTEEGMGSPAEDASAANSGSFKSRWFLGAASSATLLSADDPLDCMIMLESLWLQDRRLETSLGGMMKTGETTK